MALTKPQGDMLLKQGTENTSLSGTSVSFTGIPAGTSLIVVHGFSVSTNGTGRIGLQLGDAGGLENTGYSGLYAQHRDSATGFVGADATDAVNFGDSAIASGESVAVFQIVLALEDAANNTWSYTSSSHYTSGGATYFRNIVGTKSLSAVLDRVGLVTDGTDTFDAGSVNIAYL